MSDITQWSPVDANNNAAPPDGFPEGMSASAVNDASRAVMGGVRRQAEEGGWFDWGHAATYVSDTVFQVPGDLSAIYTTGRRVRATQTATIYGVIQSTAVSANTDVTVQWDSGVLANEALAVALGPTPEAIGLPALGTAASRDVGTDVGDVPELVDVSGSAGLPAVDGSQLTGMYGTVLSEVTTTGAETEVTFTTAAWFALPYKVHRFVLEGVQASASTNVRMQFSIDGGSSWISLSQYTNLGWGKFDDGTNIDIADVQDHWGLAGAVNPATGWLSGDVWLYDLRAPSHAPRGVANLVWLNNSNLAAANTIWLRMASQISPINGIRIYSTVGAFDAGSVFRFYGFP